MEAEGGLETVEEFFAGAMAMAESGACPHVLGLIRNVRTGFSRQHHSIAAGPVFDGNCDSDEHDLRRRGVNSMYAEDELTFQHASASRKSHTLNRREGDFRMGHPISCCEDSLALAPLTITSCAVPINILK